MVEVPQVQFIDKVVDIPVIMERQMSVGASGSCAESQGEEEQEEQEMGGSLVQEGECRHEVDETGPRTRVGPSGAKHGSQWLIPQATMDQEWAKELRDIRRMVEFLVHRERELDVKTDAAARRLERLERESSQTKDEEREASLEQALTDHTKVVKLTVDNGYGFGKAPSGEVVFIHASVVQGAEVLVVGTDAWTQVVSDHARAEGGYRARKAWSERAWKEEKDRERASRAAQQVRRSMSMSETAASMLLVTGKPLQGARGFSHSAGSSRVTRQRSTTRRQDTAAMLEETLSLFVEANDKNEASMRQQLVNKARGAAAVSRILENTRGGEATLPHQDEGSVGVLQKAAKLQTRGTGGIRRRIQAKSDDWMLQWQS